MIDVEKRGTPTVALTARHFVEDAHISAEILGLSALPLAVVPETFTNSSADRIHRMVGEALDQIEAALTRAPLPREPKRQKPAERLALEGEDPLDCVERFNALFVAEGWSDGLPLVPPTPRAVERMVTASRLAPDAVVVKGLYPGMGVATAQKIAINGVMAGCRPEHMPVLIAMVRAYEGLGVAGKIQAMSTGPNAPVVLLSGPVISQLGFNNATCVAGPGSPSHVNTVVGRALRLILMNIGQNYPGVMDMDTIGTANKYSFCLAENAERSPWEPWNVLQGFDRETSTCSIALVYPGPDLYDFTATRAEELLSTLATLTGSYIGVAGVGRWLYGGWQDPETKKHIKERNIVLLAPAHAALFGQDGLSRAEAQQALHQKSRIPFRQLFSTTVRPLAPALLQAHPELSWLLDQPDTLVCTAETPDCYEYFVTGGDAGRSQFLFAGSDVSTVPIDV